MQKFAIKGNDKVIIVDGVVPRVLVFGYAKDIGGMVLSMALSQMHIGGGLHLTKLA